MDYVESKDRERGMEGLPLEAVIVKMTTDQRGRRRGGRATVEVTLVDEESIPDATSELPFGYAKHETPDLSSWSRDRVEERRPGSGAEEDSSDRNRSW